MSGAFLAMVRVTLFRFGVARPAATRDRPLQSPMLWLLLTISTTIIGCSKSPQQEFATIRKRADPQKMQQWAKQILKDYPTNTTLHPYFQGIAADSKMVILSNPPAFLNDLAAFRRNGPLVRITGSNTNRHVCLLYVFSFGFGGPGHIIEVGNETFSQITNAECMEWIPGVYYRHVHSP